MSVSEEKRLRNINAQLIAAIRLADDFSSGITRLLVEDPLRNSVSDGVGTPAVPEDNPEEFNPS